MEMKTETDQEYELIKYALTYLISNLDQDVAEDMSDYIGTDDPDEIEAMLQEIIDNY